MATIASIDTAVRANTQNFERGMKRARSSAKSFSESIRDIGKTASLLRGGAIFAGITAFSNFLARTSEEVAELSNKYRDGEVSLGGLVKGVAESIPILGGLIKTFDNISEAVTGAKAAVEKLNKEIEESEALAKLLEGPRQKQASEASGFQNILGNILDENAISKVIDINKPFAELDRELTKQSDELRNAGKKLLEAIGEPFSEDAKAVQRQIEIGIATIAETVGRQRTQLTEQLIASGKLGPLAGPEAADAVKARADQDKALEQGIQSSVELQENLNKAAELASKSIEELVKTPMQKLIEEIEKVNDLSSRGFLGGDVAKLRLQQLAEQVKATTAKSAKAFETPLFADTATFGSRAAFEARQRFVRGGNNDTERIPKDQLKALEEIKKGIDRLVDQGSNGGLSEANL